ncbi:hypothetical protein [Hymenobacter coalescens]
MNSIRIDIKFGEAPDFPSSPLLAAEAVIDNEPPFSWIDLPVDILALRESVEKSGRYFI